MKKYDLTLTEALEIIIDGGAVKGENFKHGKFLKLNTYGQLAIIDAARMYTEETTVFIGSMKQQKFRSLTVMTMKELSM